MTPRRLWAGESSAGVGGWSGGAGTTGRAPVVLPDLDELARSPLTSHEIIVSLIASTRTRTGLTVSAELDIGQYLKGIKISNQQMLGLEQGRLRCNDWHPNETTASPPQDRRDMGGALASACY